MALQAAVMCCDGKVMRNLTVRLGLMAVGVSLATLGVEVVLRLTDAVPEVGGPLFAIEESDSSASFTPSMRIGPRPGTGWSPTSCWRRRSFSCAPAPERASRTQWTRRASDDSRATPPHRDA